MNPGKTSPPMLLPGHLDRFTHRVTSAATTFAGGALTLATLLALGVLGWYEYEEIIRTDLDRVELEARILEDHATRSIDSASVLMASIAGQLDPADLRAGQDKKDALLTQAMVALPFVRSLSIVTENGEVVSTSEPGHAGWRIAMSRLGSLPAPGKEVLGPYTAGRDLSIYAAGGTPAGTNPGVGFIPLVRAHATEKLYLVALINADYFANYQVLTLNAPEKSALLVNYQGITLAASGAETPPPGTSLAAHAVFRNYLPRIEHASYVGEGILQHRHLVAFRLSRTRPMVVLVEQHHGISISRWFDTMRWFGAAALITILFLVTMTALVRRSIDTREKALAQLDSARLDLVRREQESRVLLRSLQELIFRTDAQGKLTYVNDRWAAMRGEKVAQALNRTVASIVDSADREAVADLFTRESRAGVRHATANMRSVEGRWYRFDFAVVPLTNADTIVGFAGSAVDVTERYRAQQALQHQLGLVAKVLESSPLPNATFDKRGRYITVNQAWEEFMGRSREMVVGRLDASFMSAADAALHAERDAELWRTGGRLSYEARMRHRDGSRRDVVVTKVVVAGAGATESRILSTMMDVSEFREAERATRVARDAAEEASRAKSEFIANISHELRTPLQSILGFSELGMLRGAQHPKLHAMFTDIHGSGARMLALVNDLLDVSKIESSVGAITLERADLRGLVHEVLRELSPLLAARHLNLVTELGDRPLIAKVDPVRFAQVIRNVTANAIKFSPLGSAVTVQGRRTEEDRILISVRDHGTGIPPAEVDKIFEAFVQSSTSKDGSGGTGLGLAISRKILAAHDGRIWAENMPDGGAVFHIDLPARQHLDQDTTF
jgi:PAS domain S-box-containing protein